MVIYKFENGTLADANQVNSMMNELMTGTGLNLVRMLQDREIDFSSGGFNWFGEAYVDADGRMDSVDIEETDAVFDTDKYKYYEYSDYANETRNEGSGVSEDWNVSLTGTIDLSGLGEGNWAAYFSGIEFEVAGGDTTYITAQIKKNGVTICTTPQWGGYYTSNPFPIGLIATDYSDFLEDGDDFTVYMGQSGDDWMVHEDESFSGTYWSFGTQTFWRGYLKLTIIDLDSPSDQITMDIPTGTFSSTISEAIGVPLIEDYEDGIDIKYKLTNTGSDDSGWLDYNVVSSFTAFSNGEPDTLIVKLVPKDSNPQSGFPSLKGFSVRAS